MSLPSRSQPSPFPSGEHALLKRLQRILGPQRSVAYQLGIGDDAAVRRGQSDERLIITTDTSVENVHFSLHFGSLREAATKAMVTNISDCAAMGATPDSAFVNLVFPKTAQTRHFEQIYRGFADACSRYGGSICGGDLSGGPCWMMAITLVGSLPGGQRPLMRSGIKAGDRLWCTGLPGRSAAGLQALQHFGRKQLPTRYRPLMRAHLSPQPRVAQGLLLSAQPEVHAAMDLSDGISKDGATLCYENGLSLTIKLPQPSRAMVQLAGELSVPWREWMLHGGEDYELLFAAAATFNPVQHGIEALPLGSFEAGPPGLFVEHNGQREPLACKSWDHLE